MDVAVVGSLHLDIMVEAPHLPVTDETVTGGAWGTKCGGKGGNQAVAAARFGAATAMGGLIGKDDFGRQLRDHLKSAGVDDRHVGVDAKAGSGMSVAILESSGEYGAVIVSGANLQIDAATIASDWRDLWDCRVLLLQNEVPEAVNLAAAAAVRAKGARVILNAAPARPLDATLGALVDLLVVNRIEAAMLTGAGAAVAGADDAEAAALALYRPGRAVIVTLGAAGLVLVDDGGAVTRLPALPVKLVSSHGAGDCFCGALAARWAEGHSLVGAADFARVAAGLTVSTHEEDRAKIGTAEVLAQMTA